jgi:cyclic pyranopterin phosphate synthase
MPGGGVKWKPHDSILSFEEILRLCRVMADMGICKIKVTGGEPLVRKGIPAFLRSLKAIPGVEQVTITTNGILLGKYLEEFAEIPLAGINVSMDTMSPETFRRISRCSLSGYPDEILKSIKRIRLMGIPVKINCVPLRKINRKELIGIAALAENAVDAVRFIELMPIGCAEKMEPVPGYELLSMLERNFGGLRQVRQKLGNGPAKYYTAPGFTGKIGLINAVTGGFCECCNRLRLTSDGLLKPCLSSDIALDIRSLLRFGASDYELAEAVKALAVRKPAGHSFSAVYGDEREKHGHKAMFRIGG